jgi:hypothetical protein
MRVELQKGGIGIETVIAMTLTGVECKAQLLDGMPGSPIPKRQRCVETLSDQEYADAMEERYGIREEGVF